MSYKDKMKILFVPMDFSSNCIARTFLIAEMLTEDCETIFIGFSKGGIWTPLKDYFARVKYSIHYSRYATINFVKNLKEMLKEACLIEPDVIFAFKPCLSSYGQSLLYKEKLNVPLILDIDDWELGFALDAGWKNFTSIFLNSIFEHLISFADAITVSSFFLQKRFGGHYIPHAVDTNFYDPQKYDRETIRRELGISDEIIISFIGTPRKHKGIDMLVLALHKLLKKKIANFKLLFTGDPLDSYVNFLMKMSVNLLGKERVLFVGLRSRREEPLLLAASDIIVLPQKITYASYAQVPAKVFTAMSMEKTIIASAISDLPLILKDCGLLIAPESIGQLLKAIEFLLLHPDLMKKLGRRAREKCIRNYSYSVVKPQLKKLILNVSAR